MLNNYLAARLHSHITEFQPAIIVCTHATAAGIAAQLARQKINVCLLQQLLLTLQYIGCGGILK